jgi:hypothetical protein
MAKLVKMVRSHYKRLTIPLKEKLGLDPLGCRGFELDRAKRFLATELTVEGFEGTAAFNLNDYVVVDEQNMIPRRILFRGRVGAPEPSLTVGIEVRGGVPKCTYLELSAGEEAEVRAKHLKPIRIEELVTQIVAVCAAKHVVETPQGLRVYEPEVTPDDIRAVERMQRRRRDPRTDHALLERVAELYREHPEAPNQAVAAEFEVSERTAARWAGYCSEAGLLPKAPKQGQKRL